MESLWFDIRCAARTFRTTRLTHAMIVLTIAFAVGTSTTVFSVIDAVLLQPLPYMHPEQLVLASRLAPQGTPLRATHADFRDWQDRSTIFQDLAAIRSDAQDLLIGDRSDRVTVHVVSANFFTLLGVRPVRGRLFAEGDDQIGRPAVAALSEAAWRRIFNSDPSIIGRHVRLVAGRDEPLDYEIVGVVPANARIHILPTPAFFLPDVIGPGRFDPGAVRQVIGRLAEGAGVEAAAGELSRLIRNGGPASHIPSGGGSVVSLHEAEFSRARSGLRILAVAAGLVLLMASVNIAALLLATGSRRQYEFAARTSLGATRFSLIRLLLAEHALFCVAGGLSGAVLSLLGTRLVVALSPASVPRIDEVGVDWRVLVFTLIVSTAIGLASGLLPAFVLSNSGLLSALRAAGSGGIARRRFWREALLCVQLALVLALFVGAALATHSFWKLVHVETGFNPDRVIAAQLALGAKYTLAPARHYAFQDELLRRANELPDIEAAALSGRLPTERASSGVLLPNGTRVWPNGNHVTKEYLDVLGIQLIAGRIPDRGEDPSRMAVNQAFAKRFFPGSDVLGQILPPSGPRDSREIVGVVANTWSGEISSVPMPAIYMNIMARPLPQFWLVARARRASAAREQIRELVRKIDPDLPVHFTTLNQEMVQIRTPLRFYTVVLTTFAVAGLLLAFVGVFASAHQTVSERVREIGVRIALGATPGSVRWLVMKRVLLITGVAASAGIWAGVMSGKALRSVLFELRESDGPTVAFATLALLAVTLLASYAPARRASAVDPIQALRQD